MFGVLDLIFATGIAASGVSLYASEDYKPLPDAPVAVSFHREFYRDDANCEFKGVMVPFVRDWDEVRTMGDGDHEVVQKADPSTVAGQAFLITQKVCEGKASEAILRGGDKYRLTHEGNLYRKHVLVAADLLTTPKEQQPKWLGQVLTKLEGIASTNEVAAKFLETSQQEITQVRAIIDGPAVQQATNAE